jgi:hypothetical protein
LLQDCKLLKCSETSCPVWWATTSRNIDATASLISGWYASMKSSTPQMHLTFALDAQVVMHCVFLFAITSDRLCGICLAAGQSGGRCWPISAHTTSTASSRAGCSSTHSIPGAQCCVRVGAEPGRESTIAKGTAQTSTGIAGMHGILQHTTAWLDLSFAKNAAAMLSPCTVLSNSSSLWLAAQLESFSSSSATHRRLEVSLKQKDSWVISMFCY